jgi:hypothetical protein
MFKIQINYKCFAFLNNVSRFIADRHLYQFVISGTSRHVDEIALFWDITQRRMATIYRRFGTIFLNFLTFEAETNALSRNVGKWLPLDAA